MRAVRQKGFSLVEMVVVLVLSTIVAGFTAMFISAPVQAYFAQSRRAELADSADAIVRNIGEDVRLALTNSPRTAGNGSVFALEMLATVDVLRYRTAGEVADPARELSINVLDSQFAAIGLRNNPAPGGFSYLVVNNRGAPGVADAYDKANVIAPVDPADVRPDPNPLNAGETIIELDAAFQFTEASPTRSVFLVSGAVTYLCDVNAQTLWRFEGYDFSAAQSTNAATLMATSTSSALIARNVTNCRFTAVRWPTVDVVMLEVTLASNGETLPLFYQARVERRP
jgi:MSHA biogenesis protein MshO